MNQRCLKINFIALASMALATIANSASPFHDKPDSPRSLPGDNLPPFGMLDDAGQLIPTPVIPASLLHRGPGAPPESTARGPLLGLAVEAARAAVAACLKSGYRTGVSVIDSVGDARAMLTADGSDGSHVFVAMRKPRVPRLTTRWPMTADCSGGCRPQCSWKAGRSRSWSAAR